MSEWKRCLLGELITFGNGKARPKIDGNVPVYGGNGILAYANQANYDDETIVIGRVGAYCGATYYEKGEIWVSDNALSAKAKNDNYPQFLYYFLLNLDLNQFAQGSSHPLLTQTLLKSIEVETTTNISEQQAIASVLSSLDDKIDLLQRQNQTLEEMAATLFRQWFIEEAKEDWEDGYINQMISLQNGYAFKSKDFSEIGIYKIIKIKNIDNKIVDIVNTDFVSEDIAKQCADKFQIKNGAILIAMTGAEIGKLGIVPKNSDNLLLNQRVGMFLPKFNGAEFLAYLYFITDYGQEYIWNAATGSAQPNISGYQIEQAPFPIIPTSQLEQYGSRIKPYFDKLIDNLGQIQTLQSLRDTLLPKLISGEVRLKGFEAVS